MSGRTKHRRSTAAEREARRQADRHRLEQAARELLTTDGWRRWIKVRATNGLARYSLRNQWLIACECHGRGITPTYVAGFRAFLSLNRCVRKGERAIRILAPCTVKKRDEAGETTDETHTFFRTVPVFDVVMTDPLPDKEPVPLAPPTQPVSGESHAHLIPHLVALANELDYTVEFRELPEAGPSGWCDSRRRKIVVAAGPANSRVRVLVHEIAHALGIGYEQYGRHQAEVLVDCATYIVCSSAGLDVGGESIPYIAGWGEDGALDAISEYAETLDSVARRIEETIGSDPGPVGVDAEQTI